MGGDIPVNEYEDENRGTFQSIETAKQMVSFEGMRFFGRTGRRNVTPTDIDGFIQLENENAFIFFELKHHGDAPEGQKLALKAMCDAIEKGGAHAVAFISVHGTEKEEMISAKDSIVTQIYWNPCKEKEKPLVSVNGGKTLFQRISDYITYLHEETTEAEQST